MARGHVRKRQLKRPRPDGRKISWECWVPAQPFPDGRRRMVTKKGFASEREARAWMAAQFTLIAKGLPGSPGTVGELLEQWLGSKHGLKPSARATYQRHIDLHLRAIAHLDAAKLNSADLLVLYTKLLGSGLSGTSVRSIHATVRACLTWSLRHGKLLSNAAATLTSEDLPSKNAAEMTAWTGAEVLQILDAARIEFRPVFALIARTGLRRGEALGLRWQDIDQQVGTLLVERSLVPAPGGGLDILPPKTKTSRRTVEAPMALLEILGSVRHQQTSARLISGKRPGPFGDLVFTREDGVTPLPPGVVSREFARAVKRAKVRPGRLHDLRHTFATLALAGGVPVIVVSRALGHAQPSTTLNVYGHMLAGTSGQAMAAVDAALSPK